MAEIYVANGGIKIDAESALLAFDKVENKAKDFDETLKHTCNNTEGIGNKFKSFGNKLGSMGEKAMKTGTKMSLGITTPLTLMGKKVAETGMEFDSQMSRVQGISGATGTELKSLTDKALDLGQSTSFSASQVAESMENLASSGMNTNQILQATPGVLDAAASSGEDLASVTEIVTGTMNSFGYTAKDTGHIADVLAKSSADTNANIMSMGEALKYCGKPAEAAGQSFEMVSAAIGVMADNSIQGSQAGTTLRGVFTRLANPSREAAEAMKKYGFNAYDAQGKMLPLNEIINNLSKSTAHLTDKQKQQFIAQIFGQESMSGMLALMSAGGDKLKTLTKGYENCNGAAKKMADTMQDNTKASWEQAMGAIETASIKITQVAAPAIYSLANFITNVATAFSNLSPGVQKFIIILISLVAAIGPLLILFARTITAVKTIKNGFSLLNKGIKTSITGIKNFAKASKNGTNILAKFNKAILNNIKSFANFTKTIIKNTAMAIKNGAVWLAQKVKLLAFKTAQLAVTAATKAMTIAQKALNLAMRMNPIGLVITILLALATVFVTLYNKCEWFRNGVNAVWSFITNLFKNFSKFLTGIFTTDWSKSFGVFGNIINAFMHNMSNIFRSIKRIFGGLIDFITGVFTGNWSQAWQGVVSVFGGIMDGLGAVIKAPLNAVIGLINMAIDGINSISFTAPDWVPFVGGKHFGVSLPKINYLYNGGIFTQPTLLNGGNVVGDKFKGTGSNAEAVIPLNILWSKLDAIANRPIIVKINERELITIIAEKDKEIDKMKKQLGIT